MLAADEALPRRSDPPATTATPTTIPITPTITSHRSTPPPLPEAAGSVPGVRVFTVAGWSGAATAAAIWSALADGTPAVSGRFVPHDWQNVRPGSFAIPHAGHRVRAPGRGGAAPDPAPPGPEPVPAGGPGAASAAEERAPGGATTGTSGGAVGGAGSAAAATPSHSRNAPHDPQNWSPGTLEKPHLLQIRFPGVVIRASADDEDERKVDDAWRDEERRRDHRRLGHEDRRRD